MTTVVKRQRPAARRFRGSKPQPHELAAGCWRRMIDVGRSGMQDMVARDELDVSDLLHRESAYVDST